MLPSMTKMVRSGATAVATCRISSNRASSCLWRPLVSTIIRSLQQTKPGAEMRCIYRRSNFNTHYAQLTTLQQAATVGPPYRSGA